MLAASGTLSREPIEGNPPARLYETQAGMVNSVGFQNVGVRAFVRDKLPGLAGYEINVSCPNTRHDGIYFSSDPAPLAEVVSAVRAWAPVSEGFPPQRSSPSRCGCFIRPPAR